MTPGAFDLDTATELVPHTVRMTLGDHARSRAGADDGSPSDFALLPYTVPRTYWDEVMYELKWIVWHDAYDKRKARLARIA